MEEEKEFNYILFINGDFSLRKEIVDLIATQVSSFIVEDTYVKFMYDESLIIMNFNSHFSFHNLLDHVSVILDRTYPNYFLIESPNNIYGNLSDDMKLNLFDVHNENIDFNFYEKNSDKNSEEDNFLFNFTNEMDTNFFLSEEESNSLLRKIFKDLGNTHNKPTLDELLEKIKDKGIESLTKEEKTTLDEYSKN